MLSAQQLRQVLPTATRGAIRGPWYCAIAFDYLLGPPRATTRKLCAVARPARYGLKDETRFDQRVLDCWEIPKSRIWIEGRAWGNTLRPMLDRSCDMDRHKTTSTGELDRRGS